MSLSQLGQVRSHPTTPTKPIRWKPHRHKRARCACMLTLMIFGFLFVLVSFVLVAILSTTMSRKKLDRQQQDHSASDSSQKTMKAHFPIVIVPGLISGALELWQSDSSTTNMFRSRIWGSAAMLKQAMVDPACLFRHLSLNYTTGLDPDGIKVRANLGIEGTDYLMGIYWVFAPIIEELAHIGYDPNNLFMALYDWRLSAQNMDIRDSFFLKLKSMIEIAHTTSFNRKSTSGGNANAHWIETHIHSFSNIAGPLLGATKSLSTLLSAEMRDTAELASPLEYLKEKVWSRSMLVKLFRSWSSLSDMLPKGGTRIWGDVDGAPDDPVHANKSFGATLTFTHEVARDTGTGDAFCSCQAVGNDLTSAEPALDLQIKEEALRKGQLNIDESLDLLRKVAPRFMSRVDSATSFGFTSSNEKFEHDSRRHWTNPLQTQLPIAPSMKIFCFYGVGKSTERVYSYQERQHGRCWRIPFQIDTSAEGNGITTGDGDGTVPLLSLGFMCTHGWNLDRFNPARIPVVTKEYEHKHMDLFGSWGDLRGGPFSGDHVDILGNHELIGDLLAIASDHHQPQQRIVSEIYNFSSRVDVD